MIETAYLDQHGEIPIAAAAKIATACVAIRQAARIERILATAGEPGTDKCTLSHEQWLAYSDRAVRYRESADKALAVLGLDRHNAPDPWDAIYKPQALQASAQASANGSSRPEAHLDATDAPETKCGGQAP